MFKLLRSGSAWFARAPALAAATLLALALLPLPSSDASAAASAWTRNEHTSVRLISAASGVGQGREVRLGLQFRMKPGWKIYWRSPGDAGFPPQIAWTGSENVAGAIMNWPAPTRFSILGLTS
ncbi:MAG: protein-disulfide reductase DsbD domain-containing protein, partial [Pseudomonadota bacterium]